VGHITTIVCLYFLIALPIIWWLMWREDFDGMQSEWRHKQDLKTREALTPDQFYERFYASAGVKRDIVHRALKLHACFWEVDAELIRPQDDYLRINGGDGSEWIEEIEVAFGLTIPDSDLEMILGSFDSVVRYVDARTKMNA
jgi:hypothetical protein